MMHLVQKVFSKQSPDLGLMPMKHLGPRFEAIHASMVSGWSSSLHVVPATNDAPSAQSDLHKTRLLLGSECERSILFAAFTVAYINSMKAPACFFR